MSKGWQSGQEQVLSVGEPYDDGSFFEIIRHPFVNEDGTVETRIGVRWNMPSGNYPRGKGFALPSRPEEINALVRALTTEATNR